MTAKILAGHTGYRPRGFLAASTAIGVLAPRAASAHIVGARLGDFYAGALHPMTDPLDVVLWVALGVLAGSLGPRRARWIVAAFPVGLLIGLAAGLRLGVTSTGAEVDAGLLLAMGLLLTAAPPLPAWGLAAVAMMVGCLRGLANAGAAGPHTNIVLLAAGLAFAGYAVVTLASALTVVFCRPAAGWRRIAIRATGSWVAAVGLMMGAYAWVT